MEELVIRFGMVEGPRNPTADEIRKALEDIESGTCPRPEFTIENVTNWKPEVRGGQRVIRVVMEGRYASAAKFFGAGQELPPGWVVTVHDETKRGYVLATADDDGGKYVEGICHGGPLTLRASCIVTLEDAWDALRYFAQHQDRSPDQRWMVESTCYQHERFTNA